MQIKVAAALLGLLIFVGGISIGQNTVPANPKLVAEPVIVEPGKAGGQLNLSEQAPTSLNPYSGGPFGSLTATLVHATLFETNPISYAQEPGVAESFKIEPDGKTLTVTLRNIKFSDGTPFTADDVLFTVNDLILNTEIQISSLAQLRGAITGFDGQLLLKNAEKINAQTLKFNWTAPVSQALLRFLTQFFVLPKHKLANTVKKLNPQAAPDTFAKAWGIDAKLDDITGLGPYRIKSFDAKKGALLERNAFYWKVDKNKIQLPYTNTLSLVYLADSAKESGAKLQAGELDYDSFMVDFMNFKSKDAQDLLAAAAKGGLKAFYQGPGFRTDSIIFNQDVPDEALRGVFRDVRFRQAVAHLIDRDQIAKDALKNVGFARETLLLPRSPFFDRQANVRFEPSLAKAQALLETAGLKDSNKDGVRELPNGKPLQFELLTRDSDEARVATAKILAESFAKAGIKLTVTALPPQQASARFIQQRDYQAALIGFGITATFPEDYFSIFASVGQNHFYKFSDAQSKDVPDYQKRIDEIMHLLFTESDADKRKALASEMQKLLSENLPIIWLYSPGLFVVVRPNVGNSNAIVTPDAAFGGLLEVLWRKE
jgi:peptide/nickel transport system substrate-binding protein